MSDIPLVYAAIVAVMKDMAVFGIAKDRKNQQQGYTFRGIDDTYNALSPALARHGLVMLPRILSRHCVERAAKSGGALFYVTVEAEFDLIAAEDGSKHTIRTYGEAMDSADKGTNKAMSAAYKYAAMQAFCIPTEGDHDADATTPEPAPAERERTYTIKRGNGAPAPAPASTPSADERDDDPEPAVGPDTRPVTRSEAEAAQKALLKLAGEIGVSTEDVRLIEKGLLATLGIEGMGGLRFGQLGHFAWMIRQSIRAQVPVD